MSQSSVIAVDVGGTSIKAAVIDDAGRVRQSCSVPTPTHPDASVAAVGMLVRTVMVLAPSPQAIGVVAPGHIDPVAGVAVFAANLGWRNVPLRQVLSDEFGLPISVNHDVTAGGLAELRFGAHDPTEITDAVVVQLGTGVAATLLSAGVILRGAAGLAGEFGHIPVLPGGERCPCGQRGCLERYCSAAAIGRRYCEAGGDDVDSAEVVRRLGSDALAERIWREATTVLADGLATLTMLLDPQVIVLGGGLSQAGSALLGPVQSALAERVAWRSTPRVEVSALGGQVGIAGAALLAWEEAGQPENARWTQ